MQDEWRGSGEVWLGCVSSTLWYFACTGLTDSLYAEMVSYVDHTVRSFLKGIVFTIDRCLAHQFS